MTWRRLGSTVASAPVTVEVGVGPLSRLPKVERCPRDCQIAGSGTPAAPDRFPAMTVLRSQLLEESFQIAWECLERTGELGDGVIASRFLSDTIEK